MVVTSNLGSHAGSPQPAEVGFDARQTAHRLMPVAHDVERFGIALCGYPAEHLTLVHVLEWDDVETRRRCEHCAEAQAS